MAKNITIIASNPLGYALYSTQNVTDAVALVLIGAGQAVDRDTTTPQPASVTEAIKDLAVEPLTTVQVAALVAANPLGSTTPVALWTDSTAVALRGPAGQTVAIGGAGSGTVTSVSVTAPAAGITASVATPTTTPAITLALADDLAAVEALAATGIVRRTAANTWSAGTAVDLALEVAGTLPVANGGTGATTSTGTGAAVLATAPSVTSLTTNRLLLAGNISAPAWTTGGLRISGIPATLTDTTSVGTVAAAYTDVFGGNTIAAASATTFSQYSTAYFKEPLAGTNVTFTAKFALGADSLRVGTSNPLTVSTAGVLGATSPVITGGAAFNGATSGATTVQAPAVAGTAVITLPGVTSTLATLGANTFTGQQNVMAGSLAFPAITFNGSNSVGMHSSSNRIIISAATVEQVMFAIDEVRLNSNVLFGWSSSQPTSTVSDAMVGRAGAANIRLGGAPAAVPISQALSAQNSRAGTDSNVGGSNLTVFPGTGTGTGAVSSLILKSPVLGSSGTAAQVQTTGLTIISGVAKRAEYVVSGLPTASAALKGAMAWVTDATFGMVAGYGTTVAGTGTNDVPVSCNGTNWVIG